jgi:hypothetical protein
MTPQINANPRKVKVSGLLKAGSVAVACHITPELYQSGLCRMKRQRELLESRTHRLPKSLGVGPVLKADHEIVSKTHNVTLSPVASRRRQRFAQRSKT